MDSILRSEIDDKSNVVNYFIQFSIAHTEQMFYNCANEYETKAGMGKMEKRKDRCLEGMAKEDVVRNDIIRLLNGASKREVSIIYRFIKNLLEK